MRICIPTVDDHGADSRLSSHFGSAPFFAMADTELGRIEVVPNTRHAHVHGQCTPIARIAEDRTEAVVCRGMGRNALALLNRGGVMVWITSAGTVRDTIEQLRAGKLVALSAGTACAGHEAGHTHE